MKRFSKVLAALLSALLTFSVSSTLSVNASYPSDYYYDPDDVNSVPALSVREYDELCAELEFSGDLAYASSAKLPESVDLSESPFFPPIGDQGGLGSCSAWATTYYQFTYEMHTINCINSTKKNSYSPSWTWNFSNHNLNEGISIQTAYRTLSLLGAETLSEMPYDRKDYNYRWSDNEEAMRNALKYRVKNVNIFGISGTGTAVSNSIDSDLDTIKSVLANEKVVVASMNNRSYSDSMKHIIVRGNNSGSKAGTHAVAIVGYDDNFTYDINHDGDIEPFERGALKIADSTGTFWGYDGFMYVMYDALNGKSAASDDWEADEKYERKAIFNVIPTDEENDEGYNIFYCIDVENREVNLIGAVEIDTDRRENMFLSVQHKNRLASDHYTQIFPVTDIYDYVGSFIPYSGKILLDFSNCYNSDDPYLPQFYASNHEWFIKLGSTQKGFDAASWVENGKVSCTLMDSEGNTIAEFGKAAVRSGDKEIELSTVIDQKPGDINFDGDVNSLDYVTIHQYIKGMIRFSSVQKRVADIDSDGDVDEDDKQSVLELYLH
ncbi:MAG: hypothetical protein IKM72_12795 [Oscillospiraceae bacterium]|nr:hypothetical protein [Oscillospiraceae bacterium]